MLNSASSKYGAKLGGALICVALSTVTLAWPDWIERVFGIDPDGGSGALEWLIVLGAAVAGLTLGVFARMDWKRSIATSRA